MNTAKVEPGSNVVVFGLGGIGLNVLQGARMVGANKIVGVDTNPAKRELAEKFGQLVPYVRLSPPPGEHANQTQEMILWPGVILIAVLPESKQGVWNSQLLVVREIGEANIGLECLDTLKTYQLTTEFVSKYLRLSWALCYASLQGRTMRGSLRLLDLGHPRMTNRMLLVALSRAQSRENVWLGE